jgi:hypothetical protein
MTILQIIPIAISSAALFLSLYTYLRHDAKIKKQNVLLNQLQLEKFQKESTSEKRAIIEANVINREKGKRIIKVYNKGKAIAKNVSVTFPGNPNVMISDYPPSIDIRPQHSIEIYIHTFAGSPDTMQIDFGWEDNLKSNNRDSQTVQI